MTSSPEPQIPPEILIAEQKHATNSRPTSPSGPSVLGVPGLPASMLELLIRYVPIIVLATAVYTAFTAIPFLLRPLNPEAPNTLLPIGAFLTFAGAVLMIPTYMWLSQKRRLGWNTLAIALIIQAFGQLLFTGVQSVLFSAIPVLIGVYLMLQIRDAYTK